MVGIALSQTGDLQQSCFVDADVRAGDDPREAQRRLIRDGEAMPIENHLQLNDETEESQPDSGEEE